MGSRGPTGEISRRVFVAAIGSATAWPRRARARQGAMPVIGYLTARSQEAPESARLDAAFRQGLAQAGYTEGRNVAIDARYADGRYQILPTFAIDLVRRGVALIVASGGTPPTRAAMAASSTIPIIFATGNDPVADGLVQSLSRPGGNVTGVAMMASALDGKTLALLHELAPGAAVIAVLINPAFPPTGIDRKEYETAASALNLRLVILRATDPDEIGAAFAKLDRQKVDALLVSREPFFNSRAQQIVTLAARTGLPAIYGVRDYAAAGGLMSYGSNFDEAYRQAGRYAGKILDGAKPADLPVIQSSTFQLVINLKTATALGIAIPPTLLARADEVIE